MIDDGNRKWYYLIALIVGATVVLITLLAILDMTQKGIEIPERIWTILLGAMAFVFGLHLPDSSKPSS